LSGRDRAEGGERIVRRGGKGRGGRKVARVHKQGSRNRGTKVRSLVHRNYATGVKREEKGHWQHISNSDGTKAIKKFRTKRKKKRKLQQHAKMSKAIT
jgi:hypothetical protein